MATEPRAIHPTRYQPPIRDTGGPIAVSVVDLAAQIEALAQAGKVEIHLAIPNVPYPVVIPIARTIAIAHRQTIAIECTLPAGAIYFGSSLAAEAFQAMRQPEVVAHFEAIGRAITDAIVRAHLPNMGTEVWDAPDVAR